MNRLWHNNTQTSKIISKVVSGLSLGIRVQEGYLIPDYFVSLGWSWSACVWVGINQKPEVRPHPLIDVLLTHCAVQWHWRREDHGEEL